MLQLRYRSKEFLPASRRALNEGVEFQVDVQIFLWKKSVKNYIECLFHGKNFKVNPLVMIFCIDLMSCISRAFTSRKYVVEYTECKSSLLLNFRIENK